MYYYSSEYEEWACLHDNTPEDHLEKLLIEHEGDPDHLMRGFKEAYKEWPKSWEEYKTRFHISTTQI